MAQDPGCGTQPGAVYRTVVKALPFRIPLRPVAAILVGLAAGGSIASPPPGVEEPAEIAVLRPLIRDARWVEAEAAARALVAQRAAADGEDSAAYAAALDPLIEVLVRSGRWN